MGTLTRHILKNYEQKWYDNLYDDEKQAYLDWLEFESGRYRHMTTYKHEWLPETDVCRRTKRWRYGQSTYDVPLTWKHFTHGAIMHIDNIMWYERGSKLEDLITLAKEYGQYFRWKDGKVYPNEHVAGDEVLLLLCNKRSLFNHKGA